MRGGRWWEDSPARNFLAVSQACFGWRCIAHTLSDCDFSHANFAVVTACFTAFRAATNGVLEEGGGGREVLVLEGVPGGDEGEHGGG